jgi:hypothetical protein
MTIRCTERRFGLVGLFAAVDVESFLASIDDTVERLVWSIGGLSREHGDVRRVLLDGIRASLEVVAD